jgi:hypothetical protein
MSMNCPPAGLAPNQTLYLVLPVTYRSIVWISQEMRADVGSGTACGKQADISKVSCIIKELQYNQCVTLYAVPSCGHSIQETTELNTPTPSSLILNLKTSDLTTPYSSIKLRISAKLLNLGHIQSCSGLVCYSSSASRSPDRSRSKTFLVVPRDKITLSSRLVQVNNLWCPLATFVLGCHICIFQLHFLAILHHDITTTQVISS